MKQTKPSRTRESRKGSPHPAKMKPPRSKEQGQMKSSTHALGSGSAEHFQPKILPQVLNHQGNSDQVMLNGIFANFNHLYEAKMKLIDETIPDSESSTNISAKKNVLEHWVQDVIEQNNILVQAVGELEQDTKNKLQDLETKLQESMLAATAHEQTAKLLNNQIETLQEKNADLSKEAEILRKNSTADELERDKLSEIASRNEAENENLVQLITRIRDLGAWNTTGLQFTSETFDAIFGLHPQLLGSEVQSVFMMEKTNALETATIEIRALRSEIEQLNLKKEELEQNVRNKCTTIESLQSSVSCLQKQIERYQQDHTKVKQSLEETQGQLELANTRLLNRPSSSDLRTDFEMREMLQELRLLKQQLNATEQTRREAKMESQSLKAELMAGANQMEEVQQALQQLREEQIASKQTSTRIKELEDEVHTLQQNICTFHVNNEARQMLLESKNELISQLQQELTMLQNKIATSDQLKVRKPGISRLPTIQPLAAKAVKSVVALVPSRTRVLQRRNTDLSKTNASVVSSSKAPLKPVTTSKYGINASSSIANSREVKSSKHHDKSHISSDAAHRSHREANLDSDWRQQTTRTETAQPTPEIIHNSKPPSVPSVSGGDCSCSATSPRGSLYRHEHGSQAIRKTNMDALANMMDVCVKASKELHVGGDCSFGGAPRYKVFTGRQHRRSSQAKHQETNWKVEISHKPEIDTDNSQHVVAATRTQKQSGKGTAANKCPSIASTTETKRDKVKAAKQSLKLPGDVPEDLVKNWVLNSPFIEYTDPGSSLKLQE